MDSTWTNLKRRKLFQWGAAYLAMAWAFTEVLDLVVERFHWSEWLVQAVILLLAFGFLAVLTLAWFHGERGRQRMSGAEVLLLVAIGTAAALAVRGLPTPSAGSFPPGSEVAETLEPSPFGALTAAAGVDFLSGSGAIRVAVLPFRNLTPNPEDDAFLVEGLHDEVTTQVSKITALEVVSRSSSLRFADRTDLPLGVIGDSLAARYLVEGSVRRAESRIRVSVAVVDALEDRSIWSESYDREPTVAAMFDVQSDIALNVARALEASLVPGEAERLRRQGTESEAAYDAYLRGRQKLGGSFTAYPLMAELFQQAVDVDPEFAAAWSSLGLAHVALGNFSLLPAAEAFPMAREAATRALELDPLLAEPHIVLAWVHFAYERNWAAVEEELAIAEALNPTLYGTFYLRAFLLQALGRFDEALVAASRMLELDPVGNNTTLAAGRMLHFARRFDEAMAMFTRARSISPDDPSSPFYMALTYEALGRPRDALPGLQAMALVNGIDGSAVAELPGAFAEGGAAAVWRLWIEWRLSENPPRPGWVALGHARLGEAQEAVAWFRRGIPLHDSWLFQLNDPAMDPIRDDPRFHELLEELGLPVL